MEKKEMIYLKSKDVKELREKLHEEQNCVCPVCNEVTSHDSTTLDHQHKLFKSQELHENGAGEIRGVLCFVCNAFEGMVLSKYVRQGLHKKDISQSDLLRNLANYLERDNLPYVHPSEVPKPDKIKKQSYKKLLKVYAGKAKFPEYPASGKLTKRLKELFEEYDITPEFYKS